VSVITGLAPRAVADPLVEMGSFVVRVRVVETTGGEVFGEGDGETAGEGEAIVTTISGVVTGATVIEVCGAAEVFGACLLKP
jgi:hypothetical protein